MSGFQNQQRDYDVYEIERKKQEMQKAFDRSTNVKFYNGTGDILEEEFKNNTVGLVTREEFKKKQENISVIIQNNRKKKQEEEEEKMRMQSEKRKEEYRKKIQQLSFAEDDIVSDQEEVEDNDDDENEEEEEQQSEEQQSKNQEKQNGSTNPEKSQQQQSKENPQLSQQQQQDDKQAAFEDAPEQAKNKKEQKIQDKKKNSEDNNANLLKQPNTDEDSGIIQQLDESEEIGANAVKIVAKRKQNDKELGDIITKKQFFGKNPNIDTSFLPDKLRDEEVKKRLAKQKEEYNKIKKVKMQEFIQLKYGYWDGFKLKKAMRLQKKCSVAAFIDQCRKSLQKYYVQFYKLNPEDLILVLKDVILPNKINFFEIIEYGLRNKKGELLLQLEKFQEKIGKNQYEYEADTQAVAIIYEKSKYESSKYLYPISNWHVLDENKIIDEIE